MLYGGLRSQECKLRCTEEAMMAHHAIGSPLKCAEFCNQESTDAEEINSVSSAVGSIPSTSVSTAASSCDKLREALCLSQCKNMGLLKQGVCRENCLKSKNSDERPQTNGGNKIGNRLSEEAQSMRCRRVVDVYAECSTTSFPTKVVGSSTVRKYSNNFHIRSRGTPWRL